MSWRDVLIPSPNLRVENSPRKAILKSIIKLSQHEWCKKPDQRNSKHLSLFESTNQCNATVGLPTIGNGCVALKVKFSKGRRTFLINRENFTGLASVPA